jgi:hypothetical protein
MKVNKHQLMHMTVADNKNSGTAKSNNTLKIFSLMQKVYSFIAVIKVLFPVK